MKIINYGKKDPQRVILLLGYFDCLHKGHIELIKKAKSIQDVKGCKIAMFTFKNDDFSNGGALLLFEERADKAERLGVDEIIAADFSDEFKNTSYRDFFETLTKTLSVETFVCGFDYRFGKNAEGDVSILAELCKEKDIPLFVTPKTEINGEKISTTMIKGLLSEGRVKDADYLLAEPYSITGKVVKGRQVGRQIGFPTANVNVPEKKFRIKNGVYKTHVFIDGTRYDAITNYGARPTFDLDFVLTETFVKGYEGDLYGRHITIFFDDFIRDIEKFYDVEDLKKQLEKDKEA